MNRWSSSVITVTKTSLDKIPIGKRNELIVKTLCPATVVTANN